MKTEIDLVQVLTFFCFFDHSNRCIEAATSDNFTNAYHNWIRNKAFHRQNAAIAAE